MFQKITSSLYVGQSRLYAMNSGIFFSDGQAILIDPCLFPEEIKQMQTFLAEQQLEAKTLLLTHSHWDHLFGPQYFLEVETVAHELYLQEIEADGPNIQQKVTDWQLEHRVTLDRPFEIPRPDRLLGHDSWLEIETVSLNLLLAPGHAADQFVAYHPPTATLWAADMLSDVEIPFIFDSLIAYEETIRLLGDLDILTLVPGHGAPTQNAEEISNRIMEDRFYLTELHERVEKVLTAGDPVEQALVVCQNMQFKNRQENSVPHERNVRFVYQELGGHKDTNNEI